MSKHNQYIQEITDRLVEQIKENKAPWQRPFGNANFDGILPINVDGKPYKGANLVNLMSAQQANGYQETRWLTFLAAQKLGARVKKGEKGTTIHYWKFHEERFKRDENGNKVFDDKGRAIKERYVLDRPKVFYANVFNEEQIEGLPPKEQTISIRPMEAWERHQRCENIIANCGVEIIHRPSDTAYYSPSKDHIVMPERSQFASADLYYATLLHELGHSTGHESRLNRDMSGGFGSENYAREELRAEISSMMLGQELQIGHDPGQHIAYLESWSQIVKNDPNAIFLAVKDADAINKYILAFDPAQEIEAVVEIQEERQEEKAAEVSAPVADPAAANITNSKVYLYVPFEEKDEAKALGARWDKNNKSWYAPVGSDLNQFNRWLNEPTQTQQMSIPRFGSTEQEVTEFLENMGCVVKAGHPKLDGRFHRLHIQGDKAGTLNGSYVIHTDNGIPRGFFRNFKTGEEEKFVSQQRTSSHDRPVIDTAKMKAEAEAKAKAEHDKAAVIAQGVWNASPGVASHPYLDQKGVTANGVLRLVPGNDALPESIKDFVVIGDDWRKAKALREDPSHSKIVLTKGDLLIPSYNSQNELRTLQAVSANGFKSYLKGGEKSGNYLLVGQIQNGRPILITEGYATAATLHEKTGQAVVVAFDKNNLVSVAQTIRSANPDSRIYMAADNDHQQEAKYIAEDRTGAGGELNPGIEKAKEAAALINGGVLIPQFAPDDPGSDWNDLAQKSGDEEFRRQLKDQVLKTRSEELTLPVLNIKTVNFTQPHLIEAQAKAIDLVTKKPQLLINKYKDRIDTFEGRYISSDMFKEMFDDFNKSPANRNEFNNAVHNSAASLAAEHFKQMVSEPIKDNKDRVVFLTGSPGAGKTSSIMGFNSSLALDVKAVFEGQLANANDPATLEKFKACLDANLKVEIVAVNPNPETALENTIKRCYDPNDGRGAPISTMARIQGNTHDSLKHIHDVFGDKIQLTIIDKPNGNQDNEIHKGWDKLSVLKSQGNEIEIKNRLENHLIKLYENKEISNECYKQAANGNARLLERLAQGSSRGRDQNEPRRELPKSSSVKSHELGQRDSAGSRATDSAGQSTDLRSRLENHPDLNRDQQLAIKAFINYFDQQSSGDKQYLQSKLEAINEKIPDIVSGKLILPPPPTVQVNKQQSLER